MAGPPQGPPPGTVITYDAAYAKLQAIVQAFVRYYFTPAVYKMAVFSGILTATVFSGSYVVPNGGGTYFFAYGLGVPGPSAGAGIGFLAAALLAGLGYALFGSRRRANAH